MFTIITWLTIIACILLIIIVLIQNPKGGGLAANFSAANQILGVNKTTEGVEKITWVLAISNRQSGRMWIGTMWSTRRDGMMRSSRRQVWQR